MRPALLALVVIAGCGGAPVRPARFALLPASWRTSERFSDVEPRAHLRRGLSSVAGVTAVDVEPTDGCADDAECGRAAAQRVHADRALATTLASLGTTVLARVSVIDARGGTREETRQRVVRDANARRLAEALRDLGQRIAEPYAAEPPWYETWWPWTTAALIIVAAGVAIGVGVAVSSQNGPDVVVTPP